MFVKDITYPPTEAIREPEACKRVLSVAAVDAGSYLRFATVLLQARFGSQMWVAKDVSDDMMAADIDPDEIKFEEVDWPAERMEVYFQDRDLPTLLVARFSNRSQRAEIEKMAQESLFAKPSPGDALDPDLQLLHVQVEDHEGSVVSMSYTAEDVDRFAAGEDMQDSSKLHGGMSTAMDRSEEAELRRLTILFYKVLLLAGSEGHSIRRTRDKPTRKEGGKPGFKNRPNHERLIVEYLPRHLQERRKDAETHTRKNQFNGRRGHWRHFRSEKFVNKRGTRKFIYPINGPDGHPPKRKCIVKKPTPTAP